MEHGPSRNLLELPAEIIDLLLKELDPLSLIGMRSTNLRLQQLTIAPNMWHLLLDKYCPYAKTVYEFDYAQDPEQLFCSLFKDYKAREPAQMLGMRVILAALSGDAFAIEHVEELMPMDTLEDPQNTIHTVKQGLYSLAVANGHLHFFSKLEAGSKGRAYIEALANGHLEVVNQLFALITREHLDAIDPEDDFNDPVETAILIASRFGHGLIAFQFFNRCQPAQQAEMAPYAFVAAARAGQLPLAERYLDVYATAISDEDIRDAIKEATVNGHLFVVIDLLKRYIRNNVADPHLSAELKIELKNTLVNSLFKIAAKEQHVSIILYLLQEHGIAIDQDLIAEFPDLTVEFTNPRSFVPQFEYDSQDETDAMSIDEPEFDTGPKPSR